MSWSIRRWIELNISLTYTPPPLNKKKTKKKLLDTETGFRQGRRSIYKQDNNRKLPPRATVWFSSKHTLMLIWSTPESNQQLLLRYKSRHLQGAAIIFRYYVKTKQITTIYQAPFSFTIIHNLVLISHLKTK